MRFARLSHIRTILGASAGENAVPPDLAAVSEDDEWLILDLVLNWVSGTSGDEFWAVPCRARLRQWIGWRRD